MIQWGTQFYKDMIEFWKKINIKEANILPFEYKSVDPIFKRTELHAVNDLGMKFQSDLLFLWIDR